jgi:hypothetical protein
MVNISITLNSKSNTTKTQTNKTTKPVKTETIKNTVTNTTVKVDNASEKVVKYIENDDTELFICNFYSNIDIDHVSNHNFCSEFTYISPYDPTYLVIILSLGIFKVANLC